MEMTLGELLDRLSILVRKHGGFADREECVQEYAKDVLKKVTEWTPELLIKVCRICDVNYSIWEQEAELKSDRENELYFKEIGKRALLIRDLNTSRVHLKNTLTKLGGGTFEEVKMDHRSETRDA